MSKKSTHRGECQICGKTQMLPSGKLAKHGYTVEEHFFNGVCSGSDHLPFEQSKDAIEPEVIRVRARIIEMEASVIELGRPATTPESYDKCSIGNGYRVYVKVTIIEKDGRLYKQFSIGGHVMQEAFRYSISGGNTPINAADYLNKQRAWRVTQQIKQAQSWLTWQEERLLNWVPKELRPIK